MNKIRRKTLEQISAKLDEARCMLEEVMTDEQDAFDNMHENLQCSERGEQMEEYIYNMEEGVSNLEELVSTLEEIIYR